MISPRNPGQAMNDEREPSITYTKVNDEGELEVVVRPSVPRRGGKSKAPRSRKEILEILEAYGEG